MRSYHGLPHLGHGSLTRIDWVVPFTVMTHARLAPSMVLPLGWSIYADVQIPKSASA